MQEGTGSVINVMGAQPVTWQMVSRIMAQFFQVAFTGLGDPCRHLKGSKALGILT